MSVGTADSANKAGLNHGRVLRRGMSIFGSTVNIAARIAASASPGQLLATQPVADFATALGIVVHDLGKVALRSIADRVPLFSIELAPASDPAWICPVCKMHAPFEAYAKTTPTVRGFVRNVVTRRTAGHRRPIPRQRSRDSPDSRPPRPRRRDTFTWSGPFFIVLPGQ